MRQASASIALIVCISLLASGCASTFYMGQQPSTKHRNVGPRTLVGEVAAIQTVAVVPGTAKPYLDIRGDYRKPVPTVGESAAEATGALFDEIMQDDPRAILLAPIILPLAAIAGAASAKVQQQIQEFRDDLTVDVAENADRPSANYVLAEALQSKMQRVPHVKSTLNSSAESLPDSIEGVLTAYISEIEVDVQGNDATITTTATAILTDKKTGRRLFRKSYEYAVKDDLTDWARNDTALMHDYASGARQYFAREISDRFFGKIYLRHVLRTVKSDSKGTLSWELILLGEDDDSAWANAIDESDARYDLEVYDGNQLAFSAYDIAGTSLTIPQDLQPCTPYSWSVRPIYYFGGTARAGEWLAHESATRRMHSALTGAGYWDTRPAEQLAIREITEGYPEFKTRC